MEKNRIDIAQRLGIKVKIKSETPGIFINDENGKRKVNIEELFPEFKELNQYNLTVKNVDAFSIDKEKTLFAPVSQTFSKSDLLVGAS
ncbi:hypothetical protein P4S80_17080 [Aeribacillus composti]|uniref:hypothetical protein n=1 Tax=Aeribacillus TaxID=1055323 RepID=UPI0028726251|nr:hypothetical protein [Aeribacillus pallidus]MED0717377.1 hypothetical protein [Aeribacillus composti]MED0747568.1 hypothetical protein [Aeribacillus composti]